MQNDPLHVPLVPINKKSCNLPAVPARICRHGKKPFYQHSKSPEKFQGMLKMVRDEYMQDYDALQKTLQSYTDGLNKQKLKTLEQAAKTAKAEARAVAKKR